jgi:hypothetical protein
MASPLKPFQHLMALAGCKTSASQIGAAIHRNGS